MYLRSLLLAALCVAPLAAAQAGDLAVSAQPPTPFAPPPPFVTNWTGFYVGGHVGGGFADTSWTDPFSGFGGRTSFAGLIAGIQIGINYQVNALVFGIEGDISGTTLKGNTTDAALFNYNTSTAWTSTVTGKLGVTLDRALFYGKGGVAFADEQVTVTDPFGDTASTGYTARTGWTAGAGVEYAFDRNWSARIEYDYLGFRSFSYTFFGPVIGPATGTEKLDIQRVLIGADFRY